MTRRVLAFAAVLLLCGCTNSGRSAPAQPSPAPPGHSVDGVASANAVPRFAHIVVVVEENHAYSEVIGSTDAPYINHLARTGALLTGSYGVTHPSEPNYLALFSGSTHGLSDDSCPHTYSGGNLAAQLRAHGQSFTAYSESLPQPGYEGCVAGAYARKHAPWTNFGNVPASLSKAMGAFPSDYVRLPRVAFVIPNLNHDMHDGSVAQGDNWLRAHLGGYVVWARTHDSLLIVTWDEDDTSSANHVPGVLVGAHVRQMHYTGRVDHYRMLRTIEAACRLPALGAAARRSPIGAVWAS